MKLKTILTLGMAAAVAITASAEKYRITVPVTADRQGQVLRLIDYDKVEVIDSVKLAGELVDFTGEIDEYVPAALQFAGERPFVQFVLEGGTMVYRPADNVMFGTMLNDMSNETEAQLVELAKKFRSAQTEQEQQAIYDQYNKLVEDGMRENLDNPLGYFYFLQAQQNMDPAEVLKLLDENPRLASYRRVQMLKQSLANKAATQPGSKYRDFEVTYDGKTERLSDYVGKGKYTLVDYWASWCGPCIRQTAVLKELYNKYKDKGLDVLGVAVWDDPDDTAAAIKKHDLPWHSIVNAQQIPTDLYGITGIPCIMLIGPDGTILSRDKQDDELRADVAKYLDK